MQARGYRIMVIMTAFQAEDGGSIPPTRFHTMTGETVILC